VFQFREKIYEIYEEICGARLTTNMGRIGGLNAIGQSKPLELLETFFNDFHKWKEFENLFEKSRIFFIDRTKRRSNNRKKAMDYGFTGPNFTRRRN
jgi:NADH-quinone oxidoreductase subunit D